MNKTFNSCTSEAYFAPACKTINFRAQAVLCGSYGELGKAGDDPDINDLGDDY